jgi:hypothetical protein
VGSKSNRNAIGAVVVVTSGKDAQSKMLRSGSSDLSPSELVLTFGLGEQAQADAVEVRWPSGRIDKLLNLTGGQTFVIEEGKGVIVSRHYRKPALATPANPWQNRRLRLCPQASPDKIP